MEEGSSEKISVYNEAGFQIQRLDAAWRIVSSYLDKGLREKCYWKLRTMWSVELHTDAKKLDASGKHYEQVLVKNDEGEIVNTKIGFVQKWNSLVVKAEAIQKIRVRHDLFHKTLEEMVSFLRYLQDASGKGSKYEDIEEDMMD